MRGNRVGAVVVALGMLLTGCTGIGADAGSSKGSNGSQGGESPSSPSPSEEAEPKPTMLGTQRYVSPCRLLPPGAVVSAYGNPGKYAHFRQETVEGSKTAAQMREISSTVGGSVYTRCTYSYDDKADTTITLQVDQFASPKHALRRWKRIKRLGTGQESRELAKQSAPEWLRQMVKENETSMGGTPAKGLDPSILFVPGRTNFVGVRGNLLLTLERKSYAGSFFEGNAVKGTLASTRKAFRQIYRHADDSSLDQSTMPPWWGQEQGWPEFLDPCRIFDDEAMVASAGRHSRKIESSSVLRDPDTRLVRNDRPGWKAVSNDCTRTASRGLGLKGDYWNGELELWYAAPGDTGKELLEGFVVRTLFDDKKGSKYGLSDLVAAKVLTPVEVEGAEAAYLFDYRKGGSHYGWVVGNVGPYVFQVDVTKSKRKAFGSVPMGKARLVAGAERVVENIKAAGAESESEAG